MTGDVGESPAGGPVAVVLAKTAHPDDPGAPGCWFGGGATLPPDIDWPVMAFEGLEIPLHFLCQIDLAQVPPAGDLLPRQGRLFFFWEPFLSPSMSLTRGARVIHAEGDLSGTPERRMPEAPEIPEAYFPDYREADPRGTVYRRWNMTFETFEDADLPADPADPMLDQRRKDQIAAQDAMRRRLTRAIRDVPARSHIRATPVLHRMLGGRDLDFEPGDRVLLLTIGADADLDLRMAVDPVVFSIARDDLAARDFSKITLSERP
ncbi:DUF1963 domain-containing protein [Ovoidimarina sediminis]|uniref:DUF1963 domain-containing protein n=1 Tax=Ovoidimarina sediminis TaxID=3079856 RepID=UPI0029146CBA|nr:DUF1963 domain-containing protein [Rhodophyticola sp. MJ-SS7]MDU8944380.1 DUF1963 domain-containing protein [Rhodophyticola sp. MJ-SS7]